MCGQRPCFSSVCGLPLSTSVVIIGLLELLVTLVATILNILKYLGNLDSDSEEYQQECADKDVCIGPVIKNGVFDAFFGVLCSLLLISGGYTRSPGLIVTWMLVTIIASVKYIWIFFVSDWSSLEDWIAITYLLFYTFVFLIVFSFLAEITSWRRNQGPAFGQPYEVAGGCGQPNVVINQTFVPQSPYHVPQVTTPTHYPGYQETPPPYTT